MAKKQISKESADFLYETGLNLKTRTIVLQGSVDEDMLHSLECGLSTLENAGNDPINIRLSTGGGDVYSGLTMIDRIEKSPCEIRIHAAGEIMSMGIMILAAGDVRTSHSLTVFMHHEENNEVEGRLSQSKTYLKFSDKLDDKLCRWLASRTSKPYTFWKKLGVSQDHYFFADEALEHGLIQEII